MNILNGLKGLVSAFLKRRNPLFNYPVDKQIEFLNYLGEPNDEIERSYFQYKCQMKMNGQLFRVGANFISAVLILLEILKKGVLNYSIPDEIEQYDAVFIANGLEKSYLPKEITMQFSNIKIVNMLDYTKPLGDFKFLKRILRRYPISFYFLYKVYLKSNIYQNIIYSYKPKAIISSCEYSFTSSALTYLCNLKNVKHFNIQHGEKLFYMSDSFFKFDHCFVWSEYYKDLLINMRAYKDQFIISLPPFFYDLSFKVREIEKKEVLIYDFKYYLGDELNSELERIYKILLKLKSKGFKVALRMHPRFSDKDYINRIFTEIPIEDNLRTDLSQSIATTNICISLRSAVLNQAFYCGKQIIIDDLSNPQKFTTLKEIGYFMLDKGGRLSDVMAEVYD